MSQQSGQQPPRQQTEPPPRTRVNSVFQRGSLGDAQNNFSSPLAQVFQPLVVDIPEEGALETDKVPPSGSSSPIAPIISYGPASRRRLSSLAPAPQPELFRGQQNQAHSTAFRKFPTLPNQPSNTHLHPNQAQPMSRSTSNPQPPPPFSQSPELSEAVSGGRGPMTAKSQQPQLVSSPEPASEVMLPGHTTATQLEELEETHPDQISSDMKRRLEKIEERQKRIENLLEQIVEGLGKDK
jgi:hypothetical protein